MNTNNVSKTAQRELPCDPDRAWPLVKNKQIMNRPKVHIGCSANKQRIVCVSDTHGRHRGISLPRGDILIHCGDFTDTGQAKQVKDFTKWLLEAKTQLGFSHVVVIAGNHDITFHEQYYLERGGANFHKHTNKENPMETKRILTTLTLESIENEKEEVMPMNDVINEAVFISGGGEIGQNGIIYLEDGLVELRQTRQQAMMGPASQHVTTIYGSPYQPEFCDWAFNLDRGEPCKLKWDEIPSCTDPSSCNNERVVDVLLTHGPPLGRGDILHPSGNRSGCVDLLTRVQNHVKPLFHAFGHIHEGSGEVTSDGVTTFANASTCNFHYQSINAVLVFDLMFPEVAQEDVLSDKSCASDVNDRSGGGGDTVPSSCPLRPQEVVQVQSSLHEWSVVQVSDWLQSLETTENSEVSGGASESHKGKTALAHRSNPFPQLAIKSLQGLSGNELMMIHPLTDRLDELSLKDKIEVIRAIRHLEAQLFQSVQSVDATSS